ncbi:hypothetical protein PPL_08660 [Heterostelium album PN500]|uniref:EKC/KEOPS complex subunit CGI121 n=1 Tax=Heterostelium pallidum (strain ATCC 26659 / Pp 5 / PN500) TaxID=670386 RepID=D3BJD5_HETP5|nr:hypothetical protein PPL_08660 [Heterostelium album PN500]EFA78015.1 hypothetical protein PPL_08660 [Heterostelium album PN500]|eukprot:XP_020430143.1 hypothetical protein PPL_08660 [Heterostelium album PN500]
MRQYEINIYSDSNIKDITVFKFNNVTNTQEIMDILLKGELEWSIVNARIVYDDRHLLTAATQAIHQLCSKGKLSTNNIHTELIYRMSPTTNIRDSIKTFGLNIEDNVFYIVLFGATEERIDRVRTLVKGDELKEEESDEALKKQYYPNKYFDSQIARKLYRLPAAAAAAVTNNTSNDNLQLLYKDILNSMAIKGHL